MSFDPPKSRNEAILQNMLGANNVLESPKSREEELLLQILQQGGSGGGVTPEQIAAAVAAYLEEHPIEIPDDALVIDWNNKYANAYNDAKAAMQEGHEVYLKIPNSSSNPTQCTWLQATAYDATYITFGGITSAYLPEYYFIMTYAHITSGTSNWFKWSTRLYYNPVLLKHLAPAYDSTATYSVGDYVTYGTNEAGTSGVYKCNTPIATPEEWTAAHWTKVTVMSQLASGGFAPFEIPITQSGSTYTTTASAADILANTDNCVAVLGGVTRLTPDYVGVNGTTALLSFSYIDVQTPYAPDEIFTVLVQDNSVAVVHTTRIAKELPDTTSASANDFLCLNAQKQPIWKTVPSAESNSFGGGS